MTEIITDKSKVTVLHHEGFSFTKVTKEDGSEFIVSRDIGIYLKYKDPSHFMYNTYYKNDGYLCHKLCGGARRAPFISKRRFKRAIPRVARMERKKAAQELNKFLDKNFWGVSLGSGDAKPETSSLELSLREDNEQVLAVRVENLERQLKAIRSALAVSCEEPA